MDKFFSDDDIALFKSMGAEIVREKREVEVSGLVDLAVQLQTLAATQIEASKKNTQVMLAAINNLALAVTEKKIETQDLSPILKQLIELQKLALEQPERPQYQFDIKRNSRNFMTQVVAKPVTPTKH